MIYVFFIALFRNFFRISLFFIEHIVFDEESLKILKFASEKNRHLIFFTLRFAKDNESRIRKYLIWIENETLRWKTNLLLKNNNFQINELWLIIMNYIDITRYFEISAIDRHTLLLLYWWVIMNVTTSCQSFSQMIIKRAKVDKRG
jgi:hypothetical protein